MAVSQLHCKESYHIPPILNCFGVLLCVQTSKVPDLVPEETSKEWLRSTKSIRSAGKSLREKIGFHFQDYLTDPRIGSTLLMCGCISFGIIWFRNNKPTQSTQRVRHV